MSESMEYETSGVLRHHKNALAFVAGITFVGTLFFIGTTIQSTTTTPEFTNSKKALITALLGISFGYYLGKTTTEEQTRTVWFVVGILATFIAFTLMNERLSRYSAILVLMVITIFLLFYTDIIGESKEFESWLNTARYGSVLGLVGIAFLQYGIPLVVPFSKWLTEVVTKFLAFYRTTPPEQLTTLAITLVVITLVIIYLLIFISRLEQSEGR